MKIKEFICLLSQLPQDAEIGVLSTRAYARPPSVEQAAPGAHEKHGKLGGFKNPAHAYLVRPAKDIV